MSTPLAGRLDTLAQVALRLVRTAPSGRIVLARIAEAVELDWVAEWDEQLAGELARAATETRVAVDGATVEQILREAWGAPVDEELDELELEPAAVTPTAQVHRGVLDGAPVAVKLIRPGLAATIRQDLVLLESLLGPLGAAFPALDAGALMAELRERVLDELDLEHEGMIQRRVHRALREHPELVVPAPITALTHEQVLVSEWVDGVPLSRAPDPDRAAALLVVFAFGCARAGIVHADFNPDDVLVLGDGRLAVLDFGATRTVERGRLDHAANALDALLDDDAQQFAAALDALGLLPSSHAETALEVARHGLGELAQPTPARLDAEVLEAAGERFAQRAGAIAELAVAGTLPPEDLWPARSLGHLFLTIARVGATANWNALSRSALREGFAVPLDR